MKRLAGAWLCLFVFAVGFSGMAAAQDKPMGNMPPKVLTITREFVKPGKAGPVHEKSESAFVKAMMQANWPTHYLAVDALSGKTRSLFLTPYDSFDAWEKDVRATEKNTSLSAALERAAVADGDLLTDMDSAVLAFHEEFSLRPQVDLPHMRYFEISLFQVRQGHEKDWEKIVKIVTAAYEKIPDAHWAAYQAVYGAPDTTYIIFNPLKSGAEIDKNFAAGKEFEAAMGEEGMKQLEELSAAAIEMSQTNLFAFNPRMSYPAEEWVKADPEFWKPKAGAATAPAKKAGKPAKTE